MNTNQEKYIIEKAYCFKEMAIEALTSYKALPGEDTIRHHSYLAVSATNLTFAVELALKSLCTVTNIPFKEIRSKGHTLSDLFKLVPPEIQLRLTHSYEYQIDHVLRGDVSAFAVYLNAWNRDQINRSLLSYSNELDLMLETHQKAFIQWRYNFEGKDPIIFFDYYHLILFFDLVADAIEDEIKKLIEKDKIEKAQ